VVANRIGDRRIGAFEVGELVLRQQLVIAIVGDQHAFLTDEQHGGAPLGNLAFGEEARTLASVVPGHLHGRQVAAGGELVTHDQSGRSAFGVQRRAFGLDRRRMPQFQGPERQVHVVAAKIAQAAAAKVPPAAPRTGQITGMVGSHGGGAEPQVPIEFRRHGRRIRGPVAAAVADGVPDVDLAHRPDRPRLDQLHDAAVVRAGVNLRAHLRGQFVLVGQLDHHADLRHRMGQRLFTVAVFAHPHGGHGGGGMDVIGRGDEHGVDLIAHLVQQLAKIAVLLGLGESFETAFRPALVHIAQGDDVFAGTIADVPGALPSHADAGNVQFFVRRAVLRAACGGGNGPNAESGQSGVAEHFTAGQRRGVASGTVRHGRGSSGSWRAPCQRRSDGRHADLADIVTAACGRCQLTPTGSRGFSTAPSCSLDWSSRGLSVTPICWRRNSTR